MSKTRAQVLEVLRQWVDRDIEATPVRFAGNPIVAVADTEIDLTVLADRIVAAIEDGRIVVPAKVPA